MGEIKISPSRREALDMYNKRAVTMKVKVYVVMRQSDTNCGNGPMVLDQVFAERSDAEKYVDTTPGVQGRICKWSDKKYGDFTITEKEVIEDPPTHPDSSILSAIRACEQQYKNVNSLPIAFVQAYVVGALIVHPKDYDYVVARTGELIRNRF